MQTQLEIILADAGKANSTGWPEPNDTRNFHLYDWVDGLTVNDTQHIANSSPAFVAAMCEYVLADESLFDATGAALRAAFARKKDARATIAKLLEVPDEA
jgi:hypothetical protein